MYRTDRGNKLWDNINKLRGKTGRNEDIQLLYDMNEQPLKLMLKLNNTGIAYTKKNTKKVNVYIYAVHRERKSKEEYCNIWKQ